MSDQYRNQASITEIAALFRAAIEPYTDIDEELVPGGRGLVIREIDGRRTGSVMTWGFPLHPSKAALARHPKAKLKPVNKAKGLTRPFWRETAENPANRCLIPVERFVEGPAHGQRIDQTWFSLPDQPILAWGGLWRESEEWGEVYSAVMTEACPYVTCVHDRMPVILHPADWDRWMHGRLEDIMQLQQPYDGDMVVETASSDAR